MRVCFSVCIGCDGVCAGLLLRINVHFAFSKLLSINVHVCIQHTWQLPPTGETRSRQPTFEVEDDLFRHARPRVQLERT